MSSSDNMLLIGQQSVAFRRVVLTLMAPVIFSGLAAAALPETAQAACYGSTYVSGYYRSNGTYVGGHYRTCPDSTRTNNFSYPGNYNPNTGRISSGSIYGNSSYSRSSYRTPSYSRSSYRTPSYSSSSYRSNLPSTRFPQFSSSCFCYR